MKGRIVIRAGRCKACQLCVEVCTRRAIAPGGTLNEAGYAAVVFVETAGCNGCALCAVRCPEVAIEVFRGE
jgi:2-oxoglutarate ferredoxin oxidoreductase subunit delta